MSEREDGGPAFPIPDPFLLKPGNETNMMRLASGMSLRDWFAGQVCAAQLTTTSADHSLANLDYREQVDGPTVAERIATISYRMADALLTARKERTE